jgi:competence protein ComEC
VLLFQQVSLISPFANAVAIPSPLVVTPLALLGAGCAAIPLSKAGIRCSSRQTRYSLELQAAELLARLPAALMLRHRPVSAADGCIGIGGSGSARLASALLARSLLPCWSGLRTPGVGDLWLTALDIGQGAAVVVETRERHGSTTPDRATAVGRGERCCRHTWHVAWCARWLDRLASDQDHSGERPSPRASKSR